MKIDHSSDTKRSHTWSDNPSTDLPCKPTLTKSNTAEGSHFEEDDPPKKTKGWKSSIGRARGALKRGKSSLKKVDFDISEFTTIPYEMSLPEPDLHPPSAPSSPTMFSSELYLPDRDNLRRTKSFGEAKSVRTHTTKTPKPSQMPHRTPSTATQTIYSNPPPSRPTRSSLVDTLPRSYLVHNVPLPLDESYDEIRAREYTRKSLIAKAYAEKNEAFEKPRVAPVPQTSRRAMQFAKEVGWVPFEMPRVTPRTPREVGGGSEG